MSDPLSKVAEHLVAHRGYPLRFPENTLPSITAALQAGARYVEVDVQLSRDGIPVLFHDRDLHRLCGEAGAVHDYTLQQLQAFRVRDRERFGDQFANIGIPTLHDLAELLREWPEVILFVELKRISLQESGNDKVLAAVLPELAPIAAQCVIISYAIDALQQISDYPVGAVFDDWASHDLPDIRALKPDWLFCDIETLPDGDIPVPAGHRLAVFECTDPQQALDVLARGVDLVETFAIGEMLSAMASRGDALGT